MAVETKTKYAVEDGFVETSRAAYPYHMLHAAGCPNAKRAKYGTHVDLERVAEQRSRSYSMQADFHEACIPSHSEAWYQIIQREGVLRREHQAQEKRRKDIDSLAMLKVAAARLEKELGTLTDAETINFRRTEAWASNPESRGGHGVLNDARNHVRLLGENT